MRFDLDDQQRSFQQSVADYLAVACPVRRALAPHEAGGTGAVIDDGVWRGLMELGVGGIMVPEAHGGLGLGLLDLAVVAEPIGRHAMPGPFIEHALASLAIARGGSDDQKAKWLPGLVTGALRATVALAERKGEWSADTWSLEGEAKLTGNKSYVLHPHGADVIVIGLAGGALCLVEGGAPGLDIAVQPCTDAGRQMAHLTFAETPCERLAKDIGQDLVDAGSILLAADAFGGAARCVEISVAYAREREQFGQVIGRFQALKHQLADMALMVEPAQGLYWYAAHAFDADPAAAAQAACLAKAHITELYPKIARRMIEAHGGIGYTWEFGAHVWLKRALFDQAYLGMPRAHRLRTAMLAGW